MSMIENSALFDGCHKHGNFLTSCPIYAEKLEFFFRSYLSVPETPHFSLSEVDMAGMKGRWMCYGRSGSR